MKVNLMPARVLGIEYDIPECIDMHAVHERVRACQGFKEAIAEMNTAEAALGVCVCVCVWVCVCVCVCV